MTLRGLVASVVGIALLAAGAVHAQSPTLGELAKKEEERRKALKAPTKVVTDKDVPKGNTAPPAAAAGQPAASAEDKGRPKSDEPVKDEAWWKARVTQAREELRRNEMFAEALQTRINALSNDFTARDDPYQRGRIGEDRVKALTELDRVKADIELQKKKISDIEEEGRRAGIPAGWLR